MSLSFCAGSNAADHTFLIDAGDMPIECIWTESRLPFINSSCLRSSSSRALKKFSRRPITMMGPDRASPTSAVLHISMNACSPTSVRIIRTATVSLGCDEAFRLALEDWEIWTRWEKAFKAGQTTENTHPALPEDAARHEQIGSILDGQLKTVPAKSITRSAKFLILNPPDDRNGRLTYLLVQWTEPIGPLSESIWADFPTKPEPNSAL